MKSTTPTLDEKLRYHEMRKSGLCDSWEAYLQLKQGLDTPPPLPKPIENISLDNYEPVVASNQPVEDPEPTPQEELGF